MALLPFSVQASKSGLVEAGTNVVSMDEKCFELSEANIQSPGSKGWRRYQCVYVVRADKRVMFMRDMGPSEHYKARPLRICTGVVDSVTGRGEALHTVGEAMDIADFLRSDMFEQPEPPTAHDLVGMYHDLPDQQSKARRAVSTFGPGATLQRG